MKAVIPAMLAIAYGFFLLASYSSSFDVAPAKQPSGLQLAARQEVKDTVQ